MGAVYEVWLWDDTNFRAVYIGRQSAEDPADDQLVFQQGVQQAAGELYVIPYRQLKGALRLRKPGPWSYESEPNPTPDAMA